MSPSASHLATLAYLFALHVAPLHYLSVSLILPVLFPFFFPLCTLFLSFSLSGNVLGFITPVQMHLSQRYALLAACCHHHLFDRANTLAFYALLTTTRGGERTISVANPLECKPLPAFVLAAGHHGASFLSFFADAHMALVLLQRYDRQYFMSMK